MAQSVTVRGQQFSEQRVVEIIEMYLDGRERAAKQRDETKLAKAFYKEAKLQATQHKQEVMTSGGAHSAGSGGVTRK